MSHCNCCYPVCPVPVLELEAKNADVTKCGFQNLRCELGRDWRHYTKWKTDYTRTKKSGFEIDQTLVWDGTGTPPDPLSTGSRNRKSDTTETIQHSIVFEYDVTDLKKPCFKKPEDHIGSHDDTTTASQSAVYNGSAWGSQYPDYNTSNTSTTVWSTNTSYDDPADTPDAGVIGEVTETRVYKGGTPAVDKTSPSTGYQFHSAVEDFLDDVVDGDAVYHGNIPVPNKNTGWSVGTLTSSINGSFSSTTSTPRTDDGKFPYDYQLEGTNTHYVTDSWTQKVTLSEEFTDTMLRQKAADVLAADDWAAGSGTTALYQEYKWSREKWDEDCEVVPVIEEIDVLKNVKKRKLRYRIEIPHDFDPPPSPHPQKWHGTWHKIELLETFTPSDHDPEDPGSPQPVKTTKTVTWTGPGTELDFDLDGDYTESEQEAIDSWKTDWIEIDPPTTQGTITIAMIRSQCYHGAPWAYH